MKPSKRLLLSRSTFTAFVLSTVSLYPAKAAPHGGHVVSGSGSIQQNGNVTTIQAGNGAIINYTSFNIGKGESVNFIQPNSSSRVLNRVISSDPTKIFGQIEANGIVYLINPSGIYFQNGSMLNVGHIYAAAGNISNEDFLSGKNHFTTLTGDVVNAGQISSANGVTMLGEHVANFGTIAADKNTIVLAAGNDILLGKRDSNVFVKANPTPTPASATPGVQNTGTIQAPRAIMGAGDMYSVAISNSGIIKSRDITLAGGKTGAVNVSGTLDASGKGPADKGGNIRVTGATVALQGATLNASGATGGGTVQVGGGMHGKGPLPTASKTTADATTVIKADATVSGKGGNVVVWSDKSTSFAGSISARGAGTGNGGVAEVSSKGVLSYTGSADLLSDQGSRGSLLLDPKFITISTGGTDPITGGLVAFGDNPNNSTIDPTTLLNALSGANVTLQAKTDISFLDSVLAGGNPMFGSLTLQAGRSIIFGTSTTPITLTLKGSLTAIANDPGATGVGSGTPAITMNGSTIDTTADNGNITLVNSGGGIQLGTLKAGTGTVSLNAAGAVTQTGGITAKNLELLGSSGSSYSLTGTSNTVQNLAANVDGTVNYINTGALTISAVNSTTGITATGNISLQAAGITISNAIGVGTGNLTLNSTAGVTQTAPATGAGLELLGSGDFLLTNPNNRFSTLAANLTGTNSLNYTNLYNIAVGQVNTTQGITTADGNVSIGASGLTINNAIALGAGNLTLDIFGPVSQTAPISGNGLELLGSGLGGVLLNDTSNAFKTIASAMTGDVTYLNSTTLSVGQVNTTVGIMSNGASFTLLGKALTIDDAIVLKGGNLTLNESDSVSQSAAISGAGLELLGTGNYSLGETDNSFTTIASSATGAVAYGNAGALSVGTVNSTTGITSSGANVSLQGTTISIDEKIQVGAGNLTLTASTGVTQRVSILGKGLELLGGGKFVLLDKNNAFTNLAANLTGTGSLSYRNGSALNVGQVNLTQGITTAGGSALLVSPGLTISNAIQLGSGGTLGNLTLNESGAVSQTAAIGGAGLELLGTGSFALNNGSNSFSTIASAATGDISYANGGALTVGVVNTTTGIVSGGANVALQSTDLHISNVIQTGATGNLTLNGTGTVDQTADISGNGLELLGSGNFKLNNPGNAFGTIAANLTGTGTFSYTNSAALIVGQVNTTQGITTAGGSVSLTSPGLTISNAIQLGSGGTLGNLTLNETGSVTQGTAAIGGGGLELLGTASYTLTNASNAFSTIASATTGDISYLNGGALTVGIVNGTTGITSGGANVALQATDLHINNVIDAGKAGNVTLNGSGKVDQMAPMTGKGLELLGKGDFKLLDSGNFFTTIAAKTTGNISYFNAGALSVGTVNFTDGMDSGGANILLQSAGLAIGSIIQVGAGNLTLNESGAVTQSAKITGTGLELLGSISYSLLNSGNAFKTIASAATGDLSYQNSIVLSVGQVNTTVGIKSGGASVSLSGNGLTIDSVIQVGKGNLTLNESGAVTQHAAISGTGLELLGTGSYSLNTPTNSFTTIASAATGAVAYINAGALSVGQVNTTVGIVSSGGSVALQGTTLTIDQAIKLGAGNLTLSESTSATQNAAISGGGLELLGSGNYALNNPANAFGKIAANLTGAGTFSYTNSVALTVGQVNTTQGITTAGGNVSITSPGLTISNAIQLGSGSTIGNLTLNETGSVTQGAAAVGGGGLELLGTASYALNNSSNAFSTIASAATGNISYTNGGALNVGVVNGTTGIVSGGASVALQATDLHINNVINASGGGPGNVTLNASGTVDQSAAVTGKGLELLGKGNFSLLNPGNFFSTIAAKTTGNISYFNSGALSVGTVNSTDGMDSGGANILLQSTGLAIGSIIQVGAGNLTLNESGTVTQSVKITGTGLELLGSTSYSLLNSGNAFKTIASAATGGDLSYQNSIVLSVGQVNLTVGINSSNANVSLGGTGLTIDKGILVGTGKLTLNESGAVSQTAAISGKGLELLGTGSYSLLNPANSFTTIASAATGAVAYANAGALSVGQVNTTVGIVSSGGNVTLQGTTLTIDQAIKLGSGNLTLSESTSATQNAAISGGGLELLGGGNYTLNNPANAFGKIAAKLTGAGTFTYTNSTALTVGQVNTTQGITTAGGSVSITSPGLTISNAIQLGSGSTLGNLTLNESGSVTQGAAAIGGGGLELLGTANYSLNNSSNAFSTIASSTTGNLSYTNGSALNVGVVNATTGIQSGGANVALQATNLHINNVINAGINGNVTLSASGTVDQIAAITGKGLELLGSGNFTLLNPANVFATIAAKTTGNISYFNAGALSVGTVNSTTGMDSGGGNISLQSAGLAIGGIIQVGAGKLTLNESGAVTQSAKITGSGLELLGTASYNLSDPGNAFKTISSAATGALTYQNSIVLSVGQVNLTVGIKSGNADVTLIGNGLTVDNGIQVGKGNLTLNESGAISQTTAITGTGLELLGTGSYSLLNPANSFTTIASAATGAVAYANAGALSVGQVNTTVGIVSSGGSVDLVGTTLTIDKAIQLGSGNLTLSESTSVTQNAAISGGGLELLGSGAFALSNPANAFGKIAAKLTGAGTFSYTNSAALTVGQVNTTQGVTTAGGNVSITSPGLTISNAIQLGSGSTLGNLTLNESGTVTQGAAAIGGAGLELLGTANYSLNNSSNAFSTIASAATGNLSYTNGGALAVGVVNGTTGIQSGGANVALQATDLHINRVINAGNSGNVTLTASGTVDQLAAISGKGLELLGNGDFALLNPGNLFTTIAAKTTGDIAYVNSGALSVGKVNLTDGIDSGGGEVSLKSAGLSIDSAIQVGAGNLTLNESGAVTQTAKITGTGLELLGAGSYALQNPANSFSTIASAATGALAYVNAGALTVDKVNGTTGIVSSGAKVSLQATDLQINQVIRVGAGNLTLSDSSSISQSPTGAISGSGLELLGNGGVTLLNGANSFATIAANTTGPLSYQNAGDLNVGIVNGTTGITTTSDNVFLGAATLSISQAIQLGAGNLTLNDSVGVTQSAAISGKGLEILGTGNVLLTNGANSFTTIAVNTTAAPLGGAVGSVAYVNAGLLQVGTVNSTVGITTVGANVALRGAGLQINDAIALGAGNLTLSSSAGITQTSAISGAGLELLGSGTVTLLNGANDFSRIAASVSGAINYQNAASLTVGTVNDHSGISSGGFDISLTAAGDLTLVSNVNAGVGNVLLTATGAVIETSGTVTANGLAVVSGDSPVLLSGNNINVLAAQVTGANQNFSFTNASGLTVGSVLGVTGITTNNGNVNLTSTTGDLTLLNNIQAGSGSVQLTATAGAVTESGGVVLAKGLLVNSLNSSTLTGANQVSQIAAQITGPGAGLLFANSGASLAVNTVAGVKGITANGGQVGLESAGSLTLNQAINVGAGTVLLVSQGDITQTGAGIITAGTLGARNESAAGGDIVLTLNNAFSSVAANNAFAGGLVLLNDNVALTVGSAGPAANGNFNFATTNGLSTQGGAIIGVHSNGALTLQQAVTTSGAVYLEANGAITQSGAGAITASLLGARNESAITGDITLTLNNQFGTVAAANNNNISGQVTIYSSLAGGLTVASAGPISTNGFVFQATSGITSGGNGSNGVINLGSAQGLTINAPLNAGGGVVRLESNGTIVQSATGIITAATLGARNDGSSGDIALTAANQIGTGAAAGVVAAFNAAPGGSISINDGNAVGLTVGSVSGVTLGNFAFNGTVGVKTTGSVANTNNVTLTSAGVVTLQQNIVAPGGDVLLSAGQSVIETGGIVQAHGLAITSTLSSVLSSANQISVLAANISGANQGFSYTSAGAVTIGTVLGVDGVTTNNGAVSLTTSTGDLTLASNVVSGTAGTTLTAVTGAVTEAGGAVTAGSLVVSAVKDSVLGGANQIPLLAARITGAGAGFTFYDGQNLAVDIVGGVKGITTAGNGAINLQTAGTLTLNQAVNAGAGTVRLGANGDLTQTSVGLITAGELAVRNDSATAGNIVLTQANRFSTLAGFNAFAGGNLLVVDAATGGLTIGSDAGLTTGTNFQFAPTAGLVVTGDDAKLAVQSAGAISITQAITDATGKLYLDANGGITQSGLGIITAGAAGLRNDGTTGAIALGLSNNIGTLAAFSASTSGGITVNDGGATALTIGGADALSDGTLNFGAVNGVVAVGQDIGLASGGSLTINQAVNAGVGTVRLVSQGDISQSGAGLISAGSLSVANDSLTGDIKLDQANQIMTVAAVNNAVGGNVTIVSAKSSLTVGAVSSASVGGFDFASVSGITASGSAQVAVESAGDLSLANAISDPTGTVLLEAHGNVSQSSTGTITADVLGVRNENTTGSITLGYDNNINTFAAYNAANQGDVYIVDVNPGGLTIGSIVAPGGLPNFVATSGITAHGGTVGVQSAGILNLQQIIDAGAGVGTVLLSANGAITQDTDAIITAGTLGVINTNVSTGDINLTAANQLGSIGVHNSAAGGAINIDNKNIDGLIVKSVAVNGVANEHFNFAQIDGVSSTPNAGAPFSNTIRINTTGILTLERNIAAGPSAGAAGDVSITAGGLVEDTAGNPNVGIIAHGLAIRVDSTPVLGNGKNDIQVLAADVTGAGQAFSFTNPETLAIGTVDGLSGITTSNGAVSLTTTAGDIQLLTDISAGTADVSLAAPTGTILELGGKVTAGGLAVTALNTPTLTDNNSISRLAANITGAGQSFTFLSATGFTVNTVAGVSGITTNNGAVTLTASTGDLGLVKSINAGTATVNLTATAGKLQESGGNVRAGSLTTKSALGAILGGPNKVSAFEAQNTGAGNIIFTNTAPHLGISGLADFGPGNISVNTSGDLTLSVSASAASGNVSLSSGGPQTLKGSITAGGSGSIALSASGTGASITANQDLSAGSGGVSAFAGGSVLLNGGNISTPGSVQLTAQGGTVTEAGGSSIGASGLTVKASGGVSLTGANHVGAFNGSNGSGNLQFSDFTGKLTITGISEGGGNAIVQNGGAIHVTGPITTGGGLSLIASGTETIDGAITNTGSGATLLQVTGSSSSVLANKAITVGGALTVTAPEKVIFGKAVSANSVDVSANGIEAKDDVAANGGDLVLQSATTLYLDGANYSGANVLFNDDPSHPRLASPFSSIILTNVGQTTITAKNSFTVGYLQNLLSFGSLAINAGTATIGDTAARGDLSISAGNVVLMDRQPDGASFAGRHDQGLNIVANTIEFNGASVSFSGQGNGTAFFAVSSGLPGVGKIEGMTFFTDASLDSQFQQTPGSLDSSATLLPTQPISGGVVDAEVVAALAGALPDLSRPQSSTEPRLSAATVAKLLSLGVAARDPDDDEKKGIKARKALFKQLLGKKNPTDADYQVVVNRIAPGQVTLVLSTYDRIFGPNQELKPRIEELISGQYAKYVAQAASPDAHDFNAYLVKNAPKDPQARDSLAIVAQFRQLFTQLGRIGLTPKEVEISEDVVSRSLDIEGLTPSDFLVLVGTPHTTPAAAAAAGAAAPGAAPAGTAPAPAPAGPAPVTPTLPPVPPAPAAPTAPTLPPTPEMSTPEAPTVPPPPGSDTVAPPPADADQTPIVPPPPGA